MVNILISLVAAIIWQIPRGRYHQKLALIKKIRSTIVTIGKIREVRGDRCFKNEGKLVQTANKNKRSCAKYPT